MIQVNELRYWNLVYYKVQWNHRIIAPIYHIHSEMDMTHFEPIPLTPEILDSAGWVWNEECKSYEKYPNGDVRMNLQFRESNGSYTMFNYVLKAMIFDKIYYLHQLQNLYWCLTGKELEINL